MPVSKWKKISIICLVIFAVGLKSIGGEVLSTKAAVKAENNVTKSYQNKINNLVVKIMKKSKVPGISMVLVNGNESFYLNYGEADRENSIDTAGETYYELGSMSKSFTALGVLLLVEEGKISLDDKVTDYLPWFHVYYDGQYNGRDVDEEADLRLSNLFYHTSGIPFESIGYIPEGNSKDMLMKTVETVKDSELDFYPGDKYQYATINYDILGLIIQEAIGENYEKFMREKIFEPLGLTNTCFQSDLPEDAQVANGYKLEYMNAVEYDAPRYRGNAPAGYIYSNCVDMERWMKIQMGMIEVPEPYGRIIEKSHRGDVTVESEGQYYYAGGWFVHIKGNYIEHGGNNPNYSSYLEMDTESKMGVCILSNMNSNAAEYLTENILNILEEKNVKRYTSDTYKSADMIFTIVFLISILLIIIYAVLLIRVLLEWKRKERTYIKLKSGKVAGIKLHIPLTIFLGFSFYYLPNILFQRLPWNAVDVWASAVIMRACILAYIATELFLLYVLFTFNVPKENEKNYFAMIPLGLVNGIGSALIIFTINESFNRNMEYSKELLVYFGCSLILFVYSMKLLQGRLITITNEVSFEKRICIVEKVLASPYQVIERVGRDRIFSSLNNDCAAIARMPEIIVNLISNILTLVFCVVFILTKNFYAFAASAGIILINGAIGIFTGKRASKYWEDNRTIQDIYIGQIHELVDGCKELILNSLRKVAFFQDVKKYARLTTDLNKASSIKFLNYDLYNTLMYNLIFGAVVFIFPLFISDLDSNSLRENLFIVFYMITPFSIVTNAIPQYTETNVNMKRIDKLIKELDESTRELEERTSFCTKEKVFELPIEIELREVKFFYKAKDDDDNLVDFVLGPVSMKIKSGDITYITGGNGSGKSTLGKIISGLYVPVSGEIYVQNEKAVYTQLNELFASVYSDYSLFRKLYGIDYKEKEDIVSDYLKMMKLDNKVSVSSEGEFSTINLSTGQKKRLAFAVSCIEDKKMIIFDEWAAEQDPEFRRYFYMELLPMLKKKNKGVVVITHDDRYFHEADQLIKMERGSIIDTKTRGREISG